MNERILKGRSVCTTLCPFHAFRQTLKFKSYFWLQPLRPDPQKLWETLKKIGYPKEEALLYNFLIFQVKPVGFSTFSLLGCRASFQVKPVGFSTFSLLGCRASQGLFPQPLSMSSIQFCYTISHSVTRVKSGKKSRCRKTDIATGI